MHAGFALQHETGNIINQPTHENVSTIFNSVFNVELATSPEAINEVFEVRYQVYCIDRPFEDPNCFADKREHDAYDPRSAHALIRHRLTGDSAATVRLVMAGDNPEQADFGGGSMRTNRTLASAISSATAIRKTANAPCPISASGFSPVFSRCRSDMA